MPDQVTLPAWIVWETAQMLRRVMPRGQQDADHLAALVDYIERVVKER
jgi:hypothetical protein